MSQEQSNDSSQSVKDLEEQAVSVNARVETLREGEKPLFLVLSIKQKCPPAILQEYRETFEQYLDDKNIKIPLIILSGDSQLRLFSQDKSESVGSRLWHKLSRLILRQN